jgi:hypothetical protein
MFIILTLLTLLINSWICANMSSKHPLYGFEVADKHIYLEGNDSTGVIIKFSFLYFKVLKGCTKLNIVMPSETFIYSCFLRVSLSTLSTAAWRKVHYPDGSSPASASRPLCCAH